MVVLPFAFDPSNQHSCRVVMENDCSVVEGSGGNGYALGQVALNSGKYTWKVISNVFGVVEVRFCSWSPLVVKTYM